MGEDHGLLLILFVAGLAFMGFLVAVSYVIGITPTKDIKEHK